MTNYIQVFTTLPNQESAREMARALVEHRLAACVQVSGPLESTYWWRDKIESASEWRLTAKSRVDLLPALEAAIRRHHPYDVPEILATSIVAGHPDYLEWMNHELAPDA
jgi:periplasmic divalent cation tolerance protein